MSHQHGVEDSFLIVLEVVLTEDRESLARSQFDYAFRGLQFAADGFQEG